MHQRAFTEELWLFSPGRGDILNAVGASRRKPTAPHPPARRAASAQFTNTNCSIEPPLDACHRRLHQLRLDRIYSSWLTNYSPPRRARLGPRGLAPHGTEDAAPTGLKPDESALIGVKKQGAQPLCSRESSRRVMALQPRQGRHLECRGASPRPRTNSRSGGERTVC